MVRRIDPAMTTAISPTVAASFNQIAPSARHTSERKPTRITAMKAKPRTRNTVVVRDWGVSMSRLHAIDQRITPGHSRQPWVHHDRYSQALRRLLEGHPRVVRAVHAGRPQFVVCSAEGTTMHESADAAPCTPHAVVANRHADEFGRSDPPAARLLHTRRSPGDGAQDRYRNDRGVDSTRQVAVQLRLRIPHPETALTVLKMTRLEWVAAHMTERSAGHRPHIGRLV